MAGAEPNPNAGHIDIYLPRWLSRHLREDTPRKLNRSPFSLDSRQPGGLILPLKHF